VTGRGDDDGYDDDTTGLRELSLRYAAAVDRRDGEAFAALFEADGELVVPDYPTDLRPVLTRRGTDQLRQVPSALDRYRLTLHQVSGAQVRTAGDDAWGEVVGVAHHLIEEPSAAGATGTATGPATGPATGTATGTSTGAVAGSAGDTATDSAPEKAAERATAIVWYLRYEDTYRRREGKWRFRRRVLRLLWVERHEVERIGPLGP